MVNSLDGLVVEQHTNVEVETNGSFWNGVYLKERKENKERDHKCAAHNPKKSKSKKLGLGFSLFSLSPTLNQNWKKQTLMTWTDAILLLFGC
jgi:hypothetical protein